MILVIRYNWFSWFSGGFAEVRVGVNRQTKEQVAIKVQSSWHKQTLFFCVLPHKIWHFRSLTKMQWMPLINHPFDVRYKSFKWFNIRTLSLIVIVSKLTPKSISSWNCMKITSHFTSHCCEYLISMTQTFFTLFLNYETDWKEANCCISWVRTLQPVMRLRTTLKMLHVMWWCRYSTLCRIYIHVELFIAISNQRIYSSKTKRHSPLSNCVILDWAPSSMTKMWHWRSGVELPTLLLLKSSIRKVTINKSTFGLQEWFSICCMYKDTHTHNHIHTIFAWTTIT